MKMSQTKFDKELEKALKNEALITFPDGCKYTGMTKKDPKDNKKLIPHGLGFAMWPDKQSYKGQYKNGTFDGWGHYTAPNSHEFIGVWKAGFFQGGEWKKEDGQHYVGDFKKSKFHGTGTMNYSGNYKHEGQWKDNIPNGKGKITYLKDFEENEKGTVWKGIFKDGQMHGKFEITFSDGDIIDSVFVNGVRTIAEYRDERKILLKNIKYSDADFLEKASDHLKKDKKFILKAVKLNGRALEYADDSLKKDKDVVLAAIKESHFAIWEMDDSLRKNKEIILMAVKDYSEHLECADDSLRKDKKFILEAVNKNGFALEYTNNSLKKDKEVVLKALKAIRRDLKDSKNVEDEKQLRSNILEIIDESLKNDPDILAILNKIKK
jgi:heterodisulfide reductase subunit C